MIEIIIHVLQQNGEIMKYRLFLVAIVILLSINLVHSSNNLDKYQNQELSKLFENPNTLDQFIHDMNNWNPDREKSTAVLDRVEDTQMVIITNDSFYNAFVEFAKIKNSEGIKTEVVTTSTIGTTPSQIRSWLITQSLGNSALKYVILGGDESIVPSKELPYIKNGESRIATTDFYYSNILSAWPATFDIQQIALTPNLYVGRIPARSVTEVSVFRLKYLNYKKNFTDNADRMAFVATNIQQYPNVQADNATIDQIMDNVGSDITNVPLYTEDLVDTQNGCAQPVIDLLNDRDYSFLYGMWHGGHEYRFFDSEYDKNLPWQVREFGPHKQSLTIIEQHVDYGSCWYNDTVNPVQYSYTRPASGYVDLESSLPQTMGSTYVAWIGSCYTTDLTKAAVYTPPLLDPQGNVIETHTGSNPTGVVECDGHTYHVPAPIVNAENCISEVFFNQAGGPVALYASSVDDIPYFTKNIVEEYMDMQFLNDEHKLGVLTRDSWNKISNYFSNSYVREIYLGYSLFGDPSMDVWSAKPEQLTVKLDVVSGISGSTKFIATDSNGYHVDALICVNDANGNLIESGISPFSSNQRFGLDWTITANKANYKQAHSEYSDIMSYDSTPYMMSFETGLDNNWSMYSSNEYGRIRVSSDHTPFDGTKHLTMDSSTSGQFVTNEAWLHLNLTDKDKVMLEFQWKEFGEETNPEDGVFLSSDNGITFHKVHDLVGLSTWQTITLDLDTLVNTNGLEYNRNFIIKFQQLDNYPISSDGMAFDDIHVYTNYASLPYSNGFESGLDESWEISSNNSNGRIQVTSQNTPRTGSNHLTMDVIVNNTYSTNEAKLHLNLVDSNNPILNFWWKEFGDENHPEDGIYFSDDSGINFVKVYDLVGQSYTNNTWNEVTLNIASLATANSLDLSDNFVIKFQQHDNCMIATDGFAFDDIMISNSGTGTKTSSENNDVNANRVILSNYPNPFNPNTAISFSLPSDGDVTICIYNSKGQKVKELVNNSYKSGNHEAIWNGVNDSGKDVGSGVYLYRISVNGKVEGVKKCMLLK